MPNKTYSIENFEDQIMDTIELVQKRLNNFSLLKNIINDENNIAKSLQARLTLTAKLLKPVADGKEKANIMKNLNEAIIKLRLFIDMGKMIADYQKGLMITYNSHYTFHPTPAEGNEELEAYIKNMVEDDQFLSDTQEELMTTYLEAETIIKQANALIEG